MTLVHTLLRLYPFWAVPIGMMLVEVGTFLRRRKTKGSILSWSMAGFFVVTSLLWVGFKGYRYSDEWLRQLFS